MSTFLYILIGIVIGGFLGMLWFAWWISDFWQY